MTRFTIACLSGAVLGLVILLLERKPERRAKPETKRDANRSIFDHDGTTLEQRLASYKAEDRLGKPLQ